MEDQMNVTDLYKVIVEELKVLYKVDDAILVQGAALQILGHQVHLQTHNNW